jgi:hypothetical protein
MVVNGLPFSIRTETPKKNANCRIYVLSVQHNKAASMQESIQNVELTCKMRDNQTNWTVYLYWWGTNICTRGKDAIWGGICSERRKEIVACAGLILEDFHVSIVEEVLPYAQVGDRHGKKKQWLLQLQAIHLSCKSRNYLITNVHIMCMRSWIPS